jgi:hypothetical protein
MLSNYIAFDQYKPDAAIELVWDYTMTTGDPLDLLTAG